MKVNLNYLKQFVNFNKNNDEMKELLASIGIEVDEILDIEGEPVFEVEITPNRPDWLSHYGIAREIAAKNPDSNLIKLKVEDKFRDIKNRFSVQIEDKNDCSRYSGAILKNIKVKESSPVIKSLLESFGLRPLNNIVDISNIILMTYGHPIHMFDLDKIEGEQIRVRRGDPSEKITLLDGTVAELSKNDLVISDKKTPIALAGVMGGYESGVTLETKNIFIESAWFNPALVRKTSKVFGLKTDASYLFERGADVECTRDIINLTLNFIEKDQEGDLELGGFYDEYPLRSISDTVKMEKDFPSNFSGINIDDSIVRSVLNKLGFELAENGNEWNVKVPSFRVDIHGKEDLVEEIIRIYGYDKLTSEIPRSVNTSTKRDEKRENIDSIRNFFTANGFNEVINYSFHSESDNSFFKGTNESVSIKNPIGSDFSVMRNSLISGLLHNTAFNFNNGINRVTLMEFGNIFFKDRNNICEKEMVSFSASGEYLPPSWFDKKGKKFDFFIFKSLILSYLKKIRLDVEIENMSNENS
ncbi:MAG: phenylalanine--tRNA ligase subunit beta, partial [Acidobacteriota bacterium]